MTDTTSTTDSTTTATFEQGSWQATLHASEAKRVQGTKFTKQAGVLLWKGAKDAIESWLLIADVDAGAEALAAEAQTALGGKHRKGDASKIKTVALAVKNNGLDVNGTNAKGKKIENLSMAYAEAVRLTKTVQAEQEEDDAAEAAIAALDAPNSASTPENAAKIVLSKGVDEAARLLLDALGATNEAAHRSLMRAISSEIAGRVKPKVSTTQAGPKAGATQAKPGGTAKATAKAGDGAAKAKAKPVSASKGDPNKKALPPKAKPVAAPAKKAMPVVKRPARPTS